MRFDVLKCFVDFASTLLKISHTYNVLPSNIKYPSHQQLYEIFSAAFGHKSFASLKTDHNQSLISDSELTQQRIENIYFKLNPKHKVQYLSKSIEFTIKLVSFTIISAPCRDFRRLSPMEMLAMSEVRIQQPNLTLLKKIPYKNSMSAIYHQVIDSNDWLKLFSLPILHFYYHQATNNWVKINIAEVFTKKISKEYILVFNFFWNANFSSGLEVQNRVFINDDMSVPLTYPDNFSALINFNLFV